MTGEPTIVAASLISIISRGDIHWPPATRQSSDSSIARPRLTRGMVEGQDPIADRQTVMVAVAHDNQLLIEGRIREIVADADLESLDPRRRDRRCAARPDPARDPHRAGTAADAGRFPRHLPAPG